MTKAVPDTHPKNAITYHWGDDHLLITLGNRTQERIKILFWAEFLFTTGMATIFLKEAFDFSGSVLKTVCILAAGVLYLLASYRFFSRILYSEKIFLDQESITIVQRTPFTLVNRSYKWSDIGPIHYIGKTKKTDHPLKGNCYDYFVLKPRSVSFKIFTRKAIYISTILAIPFVLVKVFTRGMRKK